MSWGRERPSEALVKTSRNSNHGCDHPVPILNAQLPISVRPISHSVCLVVSFKCIRLCFAWRFPWHEFCFAWGRLYTRVYGEGSLSESCIENCLLHVCFGCMEMNVTMYENDCGLACESWWCAEGLYFLEFIFAWWGIMRGEYREEWPSFAFPWGLHDWEMMRVAESFLYFFLACRCMSLHGRIVALPKLDNGMVLALPLQDFAWWELAWRGLTSVLM